ncbi:GNAT family N-acetyltransferase [Streptomyces sp. APSN-46.1]|uniref:GNAT family N-acetyltransferase n=1 Tax=Streptomyces sp. APSN-46.1 TaxID=2929049 RepID=UPI001FB2A402|nr:GNAT family N-acetyltransferase [Streptomyces sp. APSN-46.1]MCJ1676858.1 GNAT family N-acetyltransferase [Streptomyces sp. APSN-46.1]
MEDLVTQRLVLHPLSVQEAASLARGEPEGHGRWARGYPTAADIAGARRHLDTCALQGDPQPFGPYEIRRREDGEAIGGLGFHGPPDEDGTVTIGYGLAPSAQGRGYAAEALRALLGFARAHGVRQVLGDTDRGNIASQRVMAAAGMEPVGEDDRLKYYAVRWPVPADGPGSPA